ncbi:hypothetical protein B0H10DRAFT_760775 [Mycena sp. CBHHK59/15]|nr:hypothetical protein B0H10DRAFT_760775 [Mycena sp. CBHHK59/15]
MSDDSGERRQPGPRHLLDSFCPLVTLRRCVRYQSPSTVQAFEDVCSAVWWPSAGGSNGPYSRCLEGEIKLPKDLASSSSIGRFSISYTVVVQSFDAAGFTPSSSQPILVEPVTIATMHARDSPRPQAYAPPAYAPLPVPRQHNDFYAVPATMRQGR